MKHCKVCGSQYVNLMFHTQGRCLDCYYNKRQPTQCRHKIFTITKPWLVVCRHCERKFRIRLIDIPRNKQEMEEREQRKIWLKEDEKRRKEWEKERRKRREKRNNGVQ